MNEITWLLLGAGMATAVAVVLIRLLQGKRSQGSDAIPSDGLGLGREGAQVLERMSEGLLVLSNRLRPVTANSAARRLLGLHDEVLPVRLPTDEVTALAKVALDSDARTEDVVGIWFPARRDVRVRAEPLDDGSGVVVFLSDITEELKTQRIRREFVAHASHELKSPVASMQTLAEAVQRAVYDDPEIAVRFTDRLVTEASRLSRLIGDLLDLSRLEDPVDLPDEIVDLAVAGEKVVGDLTAEAQAKKMVLRTNLGPSVWVKGDEAQLQAMIRNLLENAIHYTQEGGNVVLYVRNEGPDAIVRVSDNGMGIPQEAQGRVFERFYRVDRARSRDRGGTGLGLAIVKHVVDLHGGSVELTSELGEGSTFTIRIPSAVQPRARSVAG